MRFGNSRESTVLFNSNWIVYLIDNITSLNHKSLKLQPHTQRHTHLALNCNILFSIVQDRNGLFVKSITLFIISIVL